MGAFRLARALAKPRHVALIATIGTGGALCYYEADAPSSERLGRWAEKWAAGAIAFHQREVHPTLLKHHEALFPLAPDEDWRPRRVLVPLCGKTVDMPHLARLGHEVVGVEGVPLAASQFAAEHPQFKMERHATPDAHAAAKAKAKVASSAAAACAAEAAPDFIAAPAFAGARAGYVFTNRHGRVGYHTDAVAEAAAAAADAAAAPARTAADAIERADWLSAGAHAVPRRDARAAGGALWLAVADWFEAGATQRLGTFSRAWDRGGLVAVPPAARARYAAALDARLEGDARVLLSVFEYNQAKAPGPPFALGAADVASLFGDRYTVTVLARTDVTADFRKRAGTPWERIDAMHELAILLVKAPDRPLWRRIIWPF